MALPQPELPLQYGPGGTSHRLAEPPEYLMTAAKDWAAKQGNAHPDVGNITSGPSHLATYHAFRQNKDQPPTRGTMASYEQLRQEVGAQFDYLTKPQQQGGLGVNVQFQDEDPYPGGVRDLVQDLSQRRLKVYKTQGQQGHTFFTNEENDRFRAVHDAFGHSATGRSFSRHGEEAAYASHASMFSRKALPALVSETRGQNSHVIYDDPNKPDNFPANRPVNMPEWTTRVGELPPEKARKPHPWKQLRLF